ncbi:MAG: hypothetical protein SF069_08630 [Phycisphaerae bacterium]|nr:hypothetical protein [Phycisphaerae bacterium]
MDQRKFQKRLAAIAAGGVAFGWFQAFGNLAVGDLITTFFATLFSSLFSVFFGTLLGGGAA